MLNLDYKKLYSANHSLVNSNNSDFFNICINFDYFIDIFEQVN